MFATDQSKSKMQGKHSTVVDILFENNMRTYDFAYLASSHKIGNHYEINFRVLNFEPGNNIFS